jgi:hypothetical protein
MKLNPARTLCAVLLVAAGLTAQIAYFQDNAPAAGGANTIPFRDSSWGTSGYTVYCVYPAATLTAAGIPAGSVLTDLAIAPANTTGASGTINFSLAQVYFGHLALNPPQAGQWFNNVAGAVTLWDTAIDGPLVFNWTADAWSSHPIACHGVGFAWDGVTDVVFYQSLAGTSFAGGGWTGGFSIHSGTGFTRHGLNAYQPTIGTAPSTTGTLGFKIRLTFSPTSTCFGLLGGTTGAGTGDLTLSVVNLPVATSEGFTLVTSSPIGPPNSGPFFGIWPDNQTWGFIATPAGAGNPLHFTVGTPGVFPLAPFSVGPGTLSFLAGQTWDAVVVAAAPGLTYLAHTNVVRLPW